MYDIDRKEFMSVVEGYFQENISEYPWVGDYEEYRFYTRYYIYMDYEISFYLSRYNNKVDVNCKVLISKDDSGPSIEIPQKLFMDNALKCCLYISDIFGNLYTEFDRFTEIRNNIFRRLENLKLIGGFRPPAKVTYDRFNNRGMLCTRLGIYQAVDDCSSNILEIYVLFDGCSVKYRVHFKFLIRDEMDRLRKLFETNKVYTRDSIGYVWRYIQNRLKSSKVRDRNLFNILEILRRCSNTIFTY